jgi:4-amino-4-deoxy-L-arabinose transferase-like glycosyltransferase
MDAESFLDERKRPPTPRLQQWLWAFGQTGVGAALLWLVARNISPERPLLRGWTGMLGLILLLHFGIFQLAALVWQQRSCARRFALNRSASFGENGGIVGSGNVRMT